MAGILCSRCGAPLTDVAAGLCPLCAGRLALDSAETPVPGDLPVGGTRVGDYELLGEIGRGSMGVVYRTLHHPLKRIVALKVMQSGQFASEIERKRFLTEAELAAALDHPNIVPVYEVGSAEGRPYCAMKLIEGRSLAALLVTGLCPRRPCESHRPPGLLPGGRGCCVTAAVLIAQVARAVHHAHQRGVLHRDLKPGNILVDAAGEPHITDFGLARRLDATSSLTLTGSPLGTPAYMSPEQARGEPRPTTASDIWSLGAILYELLAGRPPFVAENVPALLRKIADKDPPPLPGFQSPRPIDPDLAVICLKCLEKNPAHRYASAAALADDLGRWQHSEPILARRTSGWERACKWTARHPRRTAMLLALAAVFLAGVGGVLWQWRRAERRAQDSRDQLLRLHILNAGQQLEAGDPLAAVPWLAGALTGESADPARRNIYRTALANTLRHSPLAEQIRWFPGRDLAFAPSPDGQRLVVTDPRWIEGTVWHVADNHAVPVPFARGGAVAVSPDGTRFALGGDGFAQLFSMSTTAARSPPLSHTGWVTQVTFSPDGRWLATRAERSGIQLWEVSTGNQATPTLAHPQHAWMTFSPDSRRLATTGQDGWLRLWDIPSGRLEVSRELGSLYPAEFSPDGQWLVVGHPRGHDARLLHAASLQQEGAPLRHLDYVVHVVFSPDSRRVATGSADGRVRIWSVPDGRPLLPAIEAGSGITALQFRRDGQVLATGCTDGRTRVWEVSSGQPASPWMRHAGAIRGLAFLANPDELAVASADGTLRIWRWIPREPPSVRLRERSEEVWMAHFDRNAAQLVVRGPHSARVYDPTTGEPRSPALEHGAKVDWAELNAQGTALLTQGRDHRLRVWSLPGGDPVRSWDLGQHIVDSAWLLDGAHCVSLTWNGEICVWPVTSNAPLWRWQSPPFEGRRLVVSPDGRWLAAAFNYHRFGLWHSSSAEPRVLESCPEELRVIRFSPDSKWLICGDNAGWVRVRRTRDGAVIGQTSRHGGRILDLAISPDNRRVASLSTDGLVRSAALPTGEPAGATIRPTRGAQRLVWSADGRRLLVTGAGQAQVWDTQAGVPMTPQLPQRREIAGAAFTARGDHLLIVTEDAWARREPLAAPAWSDADWQWIARAVSGQAVDTTANPVPWFGLGETNAAADAQKLNARWQELRKRLSELR